MSNRRRRPRHTQPLNNRQHHRRPPSGPVPAVYSIGFYDPSGDEIEITIDLNDPGANPFLVDLIQLMTDTCPHCNSEHQEDNHHGRE